MRFSRLRLLGFKSFVEPGEFVIERGLTGVVGPNGCGKSNLVEALRWVMGESSYKNMRASGMDDVIFSGSSTRPARNTAEVTLFLDNSDRTAPAAFNDADELQVSRRIEREAGSVYRINGREARARDVQLLFADQSTGARSPSMVGQGRIGELIQAKPQARRALLEEAAGISGLHTRRHEAELQAARRRAEPRAARRRCRRAGNPGREPEAPGKAGFALQEPLRRHPHGRGDPPASALDARQDAGRRRAVGAGHGDVAGRRARRRADGSRQSSRRLQRFACPSCATPRPRAAAVFQRLSIARAQLDEEAERLRARHAELSRRMQQFEADIEREERMLRDNADILERLSDEEARLKSENQSAGEREAAARSTFEKAMAVRARRRGRACQADGRARGSGGGAQAARAQASRDGRAPQPPRGQLASVERESEELERKTAGLADPLEKKAMVEAAQAGARFGGSRGGLCREGGERGARRRKCRPPAAAGGEVGACPHRDRGADARQDPRCRERRAFSGRSGRRSPSSAVSKRRSAQRSARISMPPSMPRHPSTGGKRPCLRGSGPAGGHRKPGGQGERARSPGQASRPDRHRRGRRRAASAAASLPGPAAGQPARRAVALGRADGERRCADRRRAAAGPEEPPRRARRGSRRCNGAGEVGRSGSVGGRSRAAPGGRRRNRLPPGLAQCPA